MAKFEFDEREITVKQLRKMLRSVGVQYRRWGTLHVMCAWPNYRDVKSKKQLTCRERFKKAQELMMDDFKDPENAQWWNEYKELKGYKTAKGCARVYYYHMLCELEKSHTIPGRRPLKVYKMPTHMKRTPRYRLDTVVDSCMEVIIKESNGEITKDEMWKRLTEITEIRRDWVRIKEEYDPESGKPPCRWRFKILA